MKTTTTLYSLIAVFLLGGCGKEEPSAERRVLKVETVEVVPQTGYEREARFLGMVESVQTSALAFELSGTVEAILVNEGDTVKAGQEIAHLDTSRLEAREKAQKAAVKEAEATLKLAEITMSRQQKLVFADASSEQELDEARQSRDVAEAAVSRLEAELESTEVDLRKSILLAPYDAAVARRYVDVGASISPTQSIVELLENDIPEIRVGVSPQAANEIRLGDQLTLSLPGREKLSEPAKVIRILPQRDASIRTVDIILQPVKASFELRPGDTVEVVIPQRIEASGFWIPRSALTESVRGLWAVFAVVHSKQAADHPMLDRRSVEVIHFDENRAYVDGPLQPGQLVVASGLHALSPGQHVETVSN
ncbi:efflux RND transporter periplasmic adaptor subunit [Rubellicoccus peritrichatus]|uniref:Efflux RND transporter periplasmic adaptor subunit n=1 Tax=Rubellicoccus peritrichatus TaxID=3080537 RepID=A0AAQ3LEJ2_9BACT|nr:efflux RND transporter periplasmic adaptor subunit [Puniceicoccus sp. CR14]WOO42490.1 efflux RND transporter periplasmic adaptor subunit [Puniceicoccus sp. CR14]